MSASLITGGCILRCKTCSSVVAVPLRASRLYWCTLQIFCVMIFNGLN